MHPNDEPTRVAVRVPIPAGATYGSSEVATARREADDLLERISAHVLTADLVEDEDGRALQLTAVVR